MSPILKTLEQLCYVIECVAVDYMGEAKSALCSLCMNLESNPEFMFEGCETIASELRLALDQFKGCKKMVGASGLCRISRQLWQGALNSLADDACTSNVCVDPFFNNASISG